MNSDSNNFDMAVHTWPSTLFIEPLSSFLPLILFSVLLVDGDICSETSQLLVSAANGSMMHAGGTAAAIIRAAGHAVSDESESLRDTLFGGKLPACVGRMHVLQCD